MTALWLRLCWTARWAVAKARGAYWTGRFYIARWRYERALRTYAQTRWPIWRSRVRRSWVRRIKGAALTVFLFPWKRRKPRTEFLLDMFFLGWSTPLFVREVIAHNSPILIGWYMFIIVVYAILAEHNWRRWRQARIAEREARRVRFR